MNSASIRSLESLQDVLVKKSTVLCLYSGGLDGTYLMHRLKRLRVSRVLALCVDLGGDEAGSAILKRCRALGVEALQVDGRKAFLSDFVAPAIMAQATYLNGHPICASLSRPLIAQLAYEAAKKYRCDVVVHTSNSSQNSLRRFNGALGALGFTGAFGSPFELTSISRGQKRDTLVQAGIPMDGESLHSTDTNLWGREFEYGSIDDPHHIRVPEFLFQWSRPVPGLKAATVAVDFKGGLPVALNGSPRSLRTIIQKANLAVGACGLGRYVGLEEIQGGVKVQEVREMPAACFLLDACRRLETATLHSEDIREKMHQEQLWVREAVEGRWFGSLRKASQAFIHALAQKVSGRVTYRLSLHQMQVLSVEAEHPVYIRNRKIFEGQRHPAG